MGLLDNCTSDSLGYLAEHITKFNEIRRLTGNFYELKR